MVCRPVGEFRQVLVGQTSQLAAEMRPSSKYSQFSAIGTGLELNPASTRGNGRAKKGSFKMSGQSKFTQTLIAAFGALLMSTVAVGSAVGPAQAVASPVGVSVSA
jgi:hypothetical protein